MTTYRRTLNLAAAFFLVATLGACGSDSDKIDSSVCSCDPADPCTATALNCQDPVACEGDDDCMLGAPCVTGLCVNSACVFSLSGAEGCCKTNLDCTAEHPCLEGTCQLLTGQCTYTVPDDSCCVEDADCDDLSVCTTNKCEEGACVFSAVSKETCCTSNGDCNDLNPCTNDYCMAATGKCVNIVDSNVAGCTCMGTPDCEDNNPCTMEACLNSQCKYDLFLNALGVPNPGCCQKDDDCKDNDLSTLDKCVLFNCIHQKVKKCLVDSQCNDNDPCTTDTCLNGYCQIEGNRIEGCCKQDSDCDNGSNCTVDSCVDNVCASQYNAGQAGCCQMDLECNDNIACTTDLCSNYECTWVPMGQGCCHDASNCPAPTQPCMEAVCQQGQCTTASKMNCCNQNSDCNDNDPCTTEKCEVGQCFYWNVDGCCATDADCNDENPCTIDKCSGGVCATPQMVPNCCTNAGQCNDQDPCTIDKCENNKCSYSEKPDCCRNDNECEGYKEIDCQIPRCQNGTCLMELAMGCCLVDGDCTDSFPVCTVDLCIDNQCVYELADVEGCCLTNADCTSIDPCLSATCKISKQCEYSPIPGCCKTDEQCNDFDDTCTIDKCINNRCVYSLTFEDNCCLANDDCDTTDICLAPLCNTGTHQCYLEPINNCCHNDAECSDGEDVCTVDQCVNDRCVHIYTGAEGCCTTDSQCPSAYACKSGHCSVANGTCYYEDIPGCCYTALDCDDNDDVCTVDTCVANKCKYTFTGAPGCCEPFTWERKFDDGQVGGMVIANTFTMSDLLSDPMIGMLLQMMGITNITLGWQVTAACGSYSPTFSLYYGMAPLAMLGGNQCSYGLDLLGGLMPGFPNMLPGPPPPAASPIPGFDFPTDMPSSGTATTPSFTLPAGQGHHLQFWLKASINKTSDVDEFLIQVMDGDTPTTVWTKADLADADYDTWKAMAIDLKGWEGKTIKIRFSFDTLAGTGDGGTGINIDDISITADCNPE